MSIRGPGGGGRNKHLLNHQYFLHSECNARWAEIINYLTGLFLFEYAR